MFWTLVTVIIAGFEGGGIGLVLRHLRRNRLPKGIIPVCAGLAMILEETGKPERALEAYRAAIAIHPHMSGAAEAIERLETEAEGQEL